MSSEDRVFTLAQFSVFRKLSSIFESILENTGHGAENVKMCGLKRILICLAIGLLCSPLEAVGEDQADGEAGPFGAAAALGLVVDESGGSAAVHGSGPVFVVTSVGRGSPAMRAGLMEADRMVSLQGEPLAGSFQKTVAAVLDAARAAGEDRARFTFRVKRQEEEKTIELSVSLQEIDVLVVTMRGLDFLAGELVLDPDYTKSPMRSFYAPIIYAPLSGLAFLSGGSTRVNGRHALALRTVLAYVMKHGGKRKEKQDEINKSVGGNLCSLTHNSGFSAMFLAQLLDSEFPKGRGRSGARRRGDARLKFSEKQIRAKLAECCGTLEKLALRNGGWQHGSGGPNMLGYTHLMAATVTALNGLCMGKQVGVKVDEKVLKRGFKYIRSATSDGQVGYAVGNRGSFSAGRNAAALQCLIRNGMGEDPLVAPVRAKLLANLDKAARGHGSPTWHLFYVSLATAYLDRADDGVQTFFRLYGRRLFGNQQEDGSIRALDLPGIPVGTGEENRVWGALYTTPLIVITLLAPYRRDLLLYDFGKR